MPKSYDSRGSQESIVTVEIELDGDIDLLCQKYHCVKQSRFHIKTPEKISVLDGDLDLIYDTVSAAIISFSDIVAAMNAPLVHVMKHVYSLMRQDSDSPSQEIREQLESLLKDYGQMLQKIDNLIDLIKPDNLSCDDLIDNNFIPIRIRLTKLQEHINNQKDLIDSDQACKILLSSKDGKEYNLLRDFTSSVGYKFGVELLSRLSTMKNMSQDDYSDISGNRSGQYTVFFKNEQDQEVSCSVSDLDQRGDIHEDSKNKIKCAVMLAIQFSSLTACPHPDNQTVGQIKFLATSIHLDANFNIEKLNGGIDSGSAKSIPHEISITRNSGLIIGVDDSPTVSVDGGGSDFLSALSIESLNAGEILPDHCDDVSYYPDTDRTKHYTDTRNKMFFEQGLRCMIEKSDIFYSGSLSDVKQLFASLFAFASREFSGAGSRHGFTIGTIQSMLYKVLVEIFKNRVENLVCPIANSDNVTLRHILGANIAPLVVEGIRNKVVNFEDFNEAIKHSRNGFRINLLNYIFNKYSDDNDEFAEVMKRIAQLWPDNGEAESVFAFSSALHFARTDVGKLIKFLHRYNDNCYDDEAKCEEDEEPVGSVNNAFILDLASAVLACVRSHYIFFDDDDQLDHLINFFDHHILEDATVRDLANLADSSGDSTKDDFISELEAYKGKSITNSADVVEMYINVYRDGSHRHVAKSLTQIIERGDETKTRQVVKLLIDMNDETLQGLVESLLRQMSASTVTQDTSTSNIDVQPIISAAKELVNSVNSLSDFLPAVELSSAGTSRREQDAPRSLPQSSFQEEVLDQIRISDSDGLAVKTPKCILFGVRYGTAKPFHEQISDYLNENTGVLDLLERCNLIYAAIFKARHSLPAEGSPHIDIILKTIAEVTTSAMASASPARVALLILAKQVIIAKQRSPGQAVGVEQFDSLISMFAVGIELGVRAQQEADAAAQDADAILAQLQGIGFGSSSGPS